MFVPPAVAGGVEAVGDDAGADDAAVGDAVVAALVAASLADCVGVAAGVAVVPSFRPRITKMPRPTRTMTTTTNSSRCLPGVSSMAGSATGPYGGAPTATPGQRAACG